MELFLKNSIIASFFRNIVPLDNEYISRELKHGKDTENIKYGSNKIIEHVEKNGKHDILKLFIQEI